MQTENVCDTIVLVRKTIEIQIRMSRVRQRQLHKRSSESSISVRTRETAKGLEIASRKVDSGVSKFRKVCTSLQHSPVSNVKFLRSLKPLRRLIRQAKRIVKKLRRPVMIPSQIVYLQTGGGKRKTPLKSDTNVPVKTKKLSNVTSNDTQYVSTSIDVTKFGKFQSLSTEEKKLLCSANGLVFIKARATAKQNVYILESINMCLSHGCIGRPVYFTSWYLVRTYLISSQMLLSHQ